MVAQAAQNTLVICLLFPLYINMETTVSIKFYILLNIVGILYKIFHQTQSVKNENKNKNYCFD